MSYRTRFYRTNDELRFALKELEEQAEELEGAITLSGLIMLYMKGYKVEKINPDTPVEEFKKKLKKQKELSKV